MLLTTLSFLLTEPGVWEVSPDGFKVLSVVLGEFLFKDVGLLGLLEKLPVEDEGSLR
jgi:uncharacterized membrane protein YkgB